MDKSIIQHLFDGEVNPSEIIGTSNDELLKIYEKLGKEKPELIDKLPRGILARFEHIEELDDKAQEIYNRECFVYGFKLGAMLILEVLSSKDDLVPKR